jgi:hypothetical protein
MIWRRLNVITLSAGILLISTWSAGNERGPLSSVQSTFVLRSSVIGAAGTVMQISGFRQRGMLAQSTPIGVSSNTSYSLRAGFWGAGSGTATGIEGGAETVFANLLRQNYPNPFNPTTTIEYTVAKTGPVEITIYDVKGQRVRQLLDESQPPGRHHAIWDGTTEQGARVASGVYFYRIRIGTFSDVKKMVILK